MRQPIENWNEIIDNLRQFNYIIKERDSDTLNRFSQFYHWYYFPDEDAFAPSKFLGYKGTTIDNYSGEGSGGITQKALAKYFTLLSKDSKEFKDLLSKLELKANKLGKKISKKTSSPDGDGGIYIPKKEYSKLMSEYSQELYNTSNDDLNSFILEEKTPNINEGEQKSILINYYERKPELRAKAIQIHGSKCKICKFDFYKHYGEHGKDYIEVHHIIPLHTLIEPKLVNPETDMIVLCANCHRMVHRKKHDYLSIEKLKKIWKENNK